MNRYITVLILFLTINSVRPNCPDATMYREEEVSKGLDNNADRAAELALALSTRIIERLPIVGSLFGTFMGIFNDFSAFFAPGGVIERMIDERVKVAFISDKARSLNADIQTIKNRVAALEHSDTMESKRTELTVAIHTCERILYLFLNEDFPLRRDRQSTIYLKAFIPMYVSVAKLMAKVAPDYIPSLEDKMSKLRTLTREVYEQFYQARSRDLVVVKKCPVGIYSCRPYRRLDRYTGQVFGLTCNEQAWKDSLKCQSDHEMNRVLNWIKF